MRGKSTLLGFSALLSDLTSQLFVFVCSLNDQQTQNTEQQKKEIGQTLTAIATLLERARPTAPPPARASKAPGARQSRKPPPLKLPVPKPVGRG